jgi:hypothetical protein
MPVVKKRTTTNIVIVLESEQRLLTLIMVPNNLLDYVHTGKFVRETVLLHVYNTIRNVIVQAQTSLLFEHENCNMHISPSKATIARLMLKSVRAHWILNCHFLPDSDVGINAFLCIVVKDKANFLERGKRLKIIREDHTDRRCRQN